MCVELAVGESMYCTVYLHMHLPAHPLEINDVEVPREEVETKCRAMACNGRESVSWQGQDVVHALLLPLLSVGVLLGLKVVVSSY